MAQAVPPMPEEIPVELWRGFQSRAGWRGSVAGIFIAPESAADMIAMPQVRAFADRGLEGDRFFRESWSAVNRSDTAGSLIEEEVLDLAAAELELKSIAQLTERISSAAACPWSSCCTRNLASAACACAACGYSNPAAI